VVAGGNALRDGEPRDGARLFRFEEAEALWKEQDRGLSPEAAFDRAWARSVITEAMRKLREEFTAQGKEIYYRLFEEYCGEAAGAEVSYESLAKQHHLSVDDVRNYLRVIRERGRGLIKEMLRDYLFPGEDIEGELRFILDR